MVLLLSSGRYAPSDRYLIRPPPSGWLCAPRLRASRRSAPPAPCAAVLVRGSCYCKASIRYRNRYLPHPRTGEGSRLSHAFRRRKGVGFSGIFTPFGQCLRSPPPLLPPPLATSDSVKASGCPSGITPEAFTESSFILIGIDFVDVSVLRRLRRLEIGIDFVDVIALSAVGRKLPAHGVLT